MLLGESYKKTAHLAKKKLLRKKERILSERGLLDLPDVLSSIHSPPLEQSPPEALYLERI